MHFFSISIAFLAAFGIIVLGVMYLTTPRSASESFGLPLPEPGANIAWWLRLKGVRDITSGLIVLAAWRWAGPSILGGALLIEALVPLGDMSLVLASNGSKARAFGIHAPTAALMVVAGILLVSGRG